MGDNEAQKQRLIALGACLRIEQATANPPDCTYF